MRHDRVLNALTEELRRDGIKHIVDQTVDCCADSDLRLLRPDLQLRSASGEELVVDIKSPVEVAGALDEAAVRNTKHYEGVRRQVARTTGRTCRVMTFVVGALGAWWRGNWATLRACGLGRASLRRLSKRCCRDAPMASYRLWLNHCGATTCQKLLDGQ